MADPNTAFGYSGGGGGGGNSNSTEAAETNKGNEQTPQVPLPTLESGSSGVEEVFNSAANAAAVFAEHHGKAASVNATPDQHQICTQYFAAFSEAASMRPAPIIDQEAVIFQCSLRRHRHGKVSQNTYYTLHAKVGQEDICLMHGKKRGAQYVICHGAQQGQKGQRVLATLRAVSGDLLCEHAFMHAYGHAYPVLI